MNAPVEGEVLGVKVECKRLPFETSQPMLPDAMQFITSLSALITPAMMSVLDKMDSLKDIGAEGLVRLLGQIDPKVSGELIAMLVKNEKKLLSTTIVEMPGRDGQLERHELGKPKDRSWVFDQRPDLFIPLCVLAGRTTFARFFPGLAQRGDATPAE